MDIRSEIKSIIAKRGTTLKKVCAELENAKNRKISPNNMTNKLRRNTVKFEEVKDILAVLDYHIEFVENK